MCDGWVGGRVIWWLVGWVGGRVGGWVAGCAGSLVLFCPVGGRMGGRCVV